MRPSLLPALLILGLAACHQRRIGSEDGRAPLDRLLERYSSLSKQHGWKAETVYSYPNDGLKISSWRTPRAGKALWILAGIHGEEPAGPDAIARALDSLSALADSGVPIVLLPMCNSNGYRNNWRYPDTPDRDWRKGHSVGDSEYLLPDLRAGDAPRAAKPAGPDTEALTSYALKLAETYPPLLVLDFHEDELSTDGGYVYSQGGATKDNPVAAEIIRLLRQSGIPIRLSGKTRFGQTVENGTVTRDEQGSTIRDGSIDELLAAPNVFKDGKLAAGPGAPTVIVIETPAFSGARLEQRIGADSAILARIGELWKINSPLAR